MSEYSPSVLDLVYHWCKHFEQLARTQCFLVEEGHLVAMANRQRPAEMIGRDTVDGALECISPSYMGRSALLVGCYISAREKLL